MEKDKPIFRTVLRDIEIRIEEKRSVFLSVAHRAENEEAVQAFLAARRKLYPDARHLVYAFLLENGAARYADDSEPQGTAGMPTLEAIRRAELSDVVVATTRYFGGILLGAGGLTRAYAAAAKAALDAAGVAEYYPFSYYVLALNYADHRKLQNEFPRYGAMEKNCDFAENVRLTVAVPAGAGEDFCRRVVEVTAGRTIPQPAGAGREFLPAET